MPENKTAKPIVGSMGKTGTTNVEGFISGEDYSILLKDSKFLDTYDRMRKTACHSIINALILPIRQLEWSVEAPDDDKKNKEIAELLQENLFGMSITWDSILRQTLNLYLSFGFMVWEKVWDTTDKGQAILHNGKYWWKKWSPRLPKTRFKWLTGDDDGLEFFVQQVFSTDSDESELKIPIDKLVIFVNDMEGSNWDGTSILRGAVESWYYRSKLRKIDAIKHERWGIGIPDLEAPQGVTDKNSDEWKAGEQVLMNLRSHERAFSLRPFGWKLRILTPEGSGGTDILPSINYCDEDITRSVLAQFLTLGTTQTGSRSLGESFQDLFLMSLSAITKYITTTIERYAFRQWIDYNYGSQYPTPKLKHSKIATEDFKMLSEAISRLSMGGFINPNDETENYLRSLGGLPKIEIEEAQKQTQTHKIIKLKAQGLRRQPTEIESKILSLKDIDHRYSTANERLVNKMKTAVKPLIANIVRAVKYRRKDVDKIQVAGIGKLQSEYKGELLDLFREGRKDVDKEIAKQRRIQHKGVIKDYRESFAFFGEKAELSCKLLLERYKDSARLNVLRGESQGLALSDITDLVEERLMELSDKELLKIAQNSTAQAYALGRRVEAQKQEDKIEECVYSAIFDYNICPSCASKDQHQHSYAESLTTYTTPNPECYGGDKCRCVTIYLAKE